MADFTKRKVKRGRWTNQRTGLSHTFLYNPATIEEKKSANLSVDDIPGFSDPLVRWASGGVNTLSFDLMLDGEGRIRHDDVTLYNGLRDLGDIDDANDTFSLAGEIEFFESFLHPVTP